MMRRTVLILLAFVCGILVASVGPATADDAITPGPSSQPGDPFGGETVPPGPVFVITPSTAGTQLPPSSDPEDVQAQIEKDRQQAGGPSATPSSTSTAAPSDAVPTPGADSSAASGANRDTSDQADDSSALRWASGAAALAAAALVVVLLVARRRRDRAGPGSLNDHAS